MRFITVYSTSVTFIKKISTQQQHIETVLRAKKVDFEFLDIASDSTKKDEMREKMGDPAGLPPQIFNGDIYCGNYEQFQEAVENEDVLTFFHIQK